MGMPYGLQVGPSGTAKSEFAAAVPARALGNSVRRNCKPGALRFPGPLWRPTLQAMLKEGHKHLSGLEEAVLKNIEACKSLAQITRTSMGPNGAQTELEGWPSGPGDPARRPQACRS